MREREICYHCPLSPCETILICPSPNKCVCVCFCKFDQGWIEDNREDTSSTVKFALLAALRFVLVQFVVAGLNCVLSDFLFFLHLILLTFSYLPLSMPLTGVIMGTGRKGAVYVCGCVFIVVAGSRQPWGVFEQGRSTEALFIL